MKIIGKQIYRVILCVCLLTLTSVQNVIIAQEQSTIPVTWENFVRAETDKMFNTYSSIGGFGKFFHIRTLSPIKKQDVIRSNRDTRYSIGIFDLSQPLTVTLPDSKERYISMQVINQDEYTKSVIYKTGNHTFTQEKIGSRYVCLIVRILVNGLDDKDNQIVSELQNRIAVNQSSIGMFEIPNWDQKSQDKLRDAIKVLASTITDTKLCYGDVDDVNPIAHLLGAAYAWGGNPPKDAMYLNVIPENNDGKTPYILTVKDVPVDGFWSVSVYNKDGYFQENEYNAYVVNSVTGIKKNGSITIHFGGNPDQSNFLPITDGWSYIVRLYRANESVLNGSWVFPTYESVK
jgi:hypothetical protein